MKNDSEVVLAHVVPFQVVLESIEIFIREWKIYVLWAAPPLVISLASALSPFDVTSLDKENWTVCIGSAALKLLSFLLWTVFAIRVYRRIILGVMPAGSMVREMFGGRTWNYLITGFTLGVKWVVVTFLIALVPIAAAILYHSRLVMLFGSQEKVILLYDMGGQLCSYVTFIVLAELWVLLFPAVSVDEPIEFARFTRLAGHARRDIVKSMFIVWAVPVLCSTAIQMAVLFDRDLAWLGHTGVPFAVNAAGCALYVLSTFVEAVLYRELRVDWPAKDEEYERRGREAASHQARCVQGEKS